jgi:hypothetical protein
MMIGKCSGRKWCKNWQFHKSRTTVSEPRIYAVLARPSVSIVYISPIAFSFQL